MVPGAVNTVNEFGLFPTKRTATTPKSLRPGIPRAKSLSQLDFLEPKDIPSFSKPVENSTFHNESFDRRVEKARSKEEVIAAYNACNPDIKELRRATAMRWSTLKDKMPYATSGIKRWTAIGGVCMTVVSLTLTLCGAPLGAGISFVLGLAVCVACVIMGLLVYFQHRHELLHSKDGKRWHAEQLEVIKGLEQVARDQGLGSHHPDLRRIQRCKSVLEGKFWFVAVEVVKGTAIEPLCTLVVDALCWRWPSRKREAKKAQSELGKATEAETIGPDFKKRFSWFRKKAA